MMDFFYTEREQKHLVGYINVSKKGEKKERGEIFTEISSSYLSAVISILILSHTLPETKWNGGEVSLQR
jgi:hypothetical protein